MKTKITFEEEDIRQFVRQLLSLRGLQPTTFPDGQECMTLRKVEPDQFEIEVECTEGTYPDNCPQCKKPWGDPLQRIAPTPPARIPVSNEPLVHEEEEEEEVDDEAEILSISALTGQSKSLQRKGPPVDYTRQSLMDGESFEPPTPKGRR